MMSKVFWGLAVPFIGTSLGAACVFFMKEALHRGTQRCLTGFAAGAMIFVVVEELIPEMSAGEHSDIGVISFAAGFMVMMTLDVALS